MIDFMFKGDNKEALLAMASFIGILEVTNDGTVNLFDEVALDPWPGSSEWETGIPVVETPAVLDEDGNVVTPAVMKAGYHVNVRIWGSREQRETDGIPQTDTEGSPLSLKDRTRFGLMMQEHGELQQDGSVKILLNQGVGFLFEGPRTPRRVWQ